MCVFQFFREGHLCKYQSAELALEEVRQNRTEHSKNVTTPGDGRKQTVTNRVHRLNGEEKAGPKRQHLLAFFVGHSTVNCIKKASKKEVEHDIAKCHDKE